MKRPNHKKCLDYGKANYLTSYGLCTKCYLETESWYINSKRDDVEWMNQLDKSLDNLKLAEDAWKVANFECMPIKYNDREI